MFAVYIYIYLKKNLLILIQPLHEVKRKSNFCVWKKLFILFKMSTILIKIFNKLQGSAKLIIIGFFLNIYIYIQQTQLVFYNLFLFYNMNI